MQLLTFFAETCMDTMLFGRVCDDCQGGPILKLVLMTVQILTYGFGLLATIGIIVVGIKFLTARDNADQIARAKKRLFEIVIGIVAYGMIYLIIGLLTPGNIMNITADTSTSTCINPTIAEASPINGGPINDGVGYEGGINTPATAKTKAQQLAINAVYAAWPYTTGEHAGKCQKPNGSWVTWNSKKWASNDKNWCGYSLKPENKELYKTAHNKGDFSTKDGFFKTYVQDCVYFMRALVHYTGITNKLRDFPETTYGQRSAMAKSDKWQEITNNGNTKNLQPGDIFVNDKHVMIYVGEYGNGYGNMVGASARTWSARIHNAYYKNQASGQKFRIFRYIGS